MSELPTARAGGSVTRRLRTGGTAATAAQAPAGPVVLERYRLHRRLGTGAFGTVWMARDERLDRDVAVKIVARERIVGGRFEREARAAARLSHPAIVTLYEAAVDDEGAYLVSELVRGETLGTLLEAGRLSDRDIIAIAVAVCDALEHAHAQGVVHRDVKPSNILVPDAPASEAQVAKLTDFGVARVLGNDSLTLTGDVIGTLAYMAPEQAEGLEAGPSADLYSLALVVYEALTGINPIAHGATQRSRRLGTHVPPLRRQRRDLPPHLGQAIDLALRPRPRERGSVLELRRSLVAVEAEVGDEPGVVSGPARPWTTFTAFQGPQDDLVAETVPALQEESEARSRPWLGRGLAAAAAAATVAWLVTVALAPAPIAPAPAALVAGGAVLLLPRLGWVVAITTICGVALVQHHPGVALVLLVALLVPILLLPFRPTLWPVGAGAPALGLVAVAGLAGAWPALAGRAGTAWRRAALGAVGWIWLRLATPLAGRTLYLPSPAGAPGRGAWAGSLSVTVHHLLGPLASPALLAPAAVWAAAAVVLPWLLKGRRAGPAVILVGLWTAAVTAGLAAAVGAGTASGGTPGPPGAVTGAVAAAAVALMPLAGVRFRSPGPRARLP